MFRTAFRASFSPLRVAPTLPPRSLAIARRFITTESRLKIQEAVSSTPVVLFMKGTPEQPQCGFSRATIQILEMQGVPSEKFKSFNVLEDSQLRQDIKEFSDWPTIPQLYVNGEFVGGCDILLSMHQNGELEKLFEEKGVVPLLEESEAQPEAARA